MSINTSPISSLYQSDGNPFLLRIEQYLATDKLETLLGRWPLAGVDIASLTVQERLDFLDRMQDEMFEPTANSSDIATRLYRLIRRGYLARDPRQPGVRRITMELAGYAGMELMNVPLFKTNAKGMRISGITGIGKSYDLVRALEVLPQKIIHGRSDAAGWMQMTQIVWLYVAMSHDGSLGGLMLQILYAVDEAIGTTYSRDRSLTRLSNEKLAVHIGIIFRNHGQGVLVIDEIQHRNFSGNRGELAATFFLRLLNFGIPVVLMGNPYGMSELDRFSQDMRRIGSGGTFEMHPMAPDDFDWQQRLAPALWRYNVMPEPSPVKDDDGEILYKYSGGIREYACRIRVVSQRLAIDLGDKSVTEAHMEQAFMGPDFGNSERKLIIGFRDKNPLLLVDFIDVPWEEYAVKWKRLKTNSSLFSDSQLTLSFQSHSEDKFSASASPSSLNANANIKPVPAQDLENIKRSRTRKTNSAKRTSAIRSTLDSSDMRHSGLQDLLITGFEAISKDVHHPDK